MPQERHLRAEQRRASYLTPQGWPVRRGDVALPLDPALPFWPIRSAMGRPTPPRDIMRTGERVRHDTTVAFRSGNASMLPALHYSVVSPKLASRGLGSFPGNCLQGSIGTRSTRALSDKLSNERRVAGKIGNVMGEYGGGTLHSSSKKGPAVENPKQARAIALPEARKAGAPKKSK